MYPNQIPQNHETFTWLFVFCNFLFTSCSAPTAPTSAAPTSPKAQPTLTPSVQPLPPPPTNIFVSSSQLDFGGYVESLALVLSYTYLPCCFFSHSRYFLSISDTSCLYYIYFSQLKCDLRADVRLLILMYLFLSSDCLSNHNYYVFSYGRISTPLVITFFSPILTLLVHHNFYHLFRLQSSTFFFIQFDGIYLHVLHT